MSSTSSNQILEQIRSSLDGTQYSTTAVYASLIVTFGGAILISLLVWIFWPRTKTIHAKKTINAMNSCISSQPSPTLVSCIKESWKLTDKELIQGYGLDAYTYITALKMVRNIFIVFTVVLFGIATPVNVIFNMKKTVMFANLSSKDALLLLTPMLVGKTQMITHVVLAWVGNFVVFGFIWYYYIRVFAARSLHMNNFDYHKKNCVRTVMFSNLKRKFQTLPSLNELLSSQCPDIVPVNITLGQNTSQLRALIHSYDKLVEKYEKYVIKIKEPDHNKVTGYENRLTELKEFIAMERENIKSAKAPSNYAFMTFASVDDAIKVCRRFASNSLSLVVRRCPPQNHLIWTNANLNKSDHRLKQFIMNSLFATLLIIWIVPSALIGCFFSNLNRLAAVWPEFNKSMQENPVGFAILQGVLAPLITTLIFISLPYIFRKVSFMQGKITKTEREQEVLRKLFLFFFIDNFLIFTLMGVIWDIVAQVIQTSQSDKSLTVTEIWNSLHIGQRIATAIVNISSFWVMYLLRTILGLFVNASQPMAIAQKITGKVKKKTIRKISAENTPPSFQYAVSYVTLLFNATIAFAFTTIQPLVIPIVTLLFTLLVILKKYEIVHIAFTKYESNGEFWPVMCSIILFSVFFGNLVMLCVVWVQSDWYIAVAIIPLPLLVIAFKILLILKLDFAKQQPDSDVKFPFMIASNETYCDPILSTELSEPLLQVPSSITDPFATTTYNVSSWGDSKRIDEVGLIRYDSEK